MVSRTRPLSTISIVVPCCNYGRYLRDCVESVLRQAEVDIRLLIIDDASTDDSLQIACALAAADPRVEIRTHQRNQGHIRTYNEGLQWVTGTYTVLLSADDMLTPGSLRRACELLDAHPEVGFAYGAALLLWDDRPQQPRTGPERWTIRSGREWFEARCRTTENCIHSPEVVMRTHWLRQLGGYREDLPHTADLEMWMRLALHADVGYIVGPHQACYRDHALSMRHQRFGTELADLVQVEAAFNVLFREQTQLIPERPRLDELYRRRLAQRALLAACRAYDAGHQSSREAAGLEEFALATYTGARALHEWRSLLGRQQMGPGMCQLLRPFRVLTSAKRLRDTLIQRRLRRAGLF